MVILFMLLNLLNSEDPWLRNFARVVALIFIVGAGGLLLLLFLGY